MSEGIVDVDHIINEFSVEGHEFWCKYECGHIGPHVCRICGKEDLTHEHHPTPPPSFKCDCGVFGPTGQDSVPPLPGSKCVWCGKVYEPYAQRENHGERIKEDNACPTCGQIDRSKPTD